MKLSPESEQIVAATAGVVAEHAEQITRTFYPDMFAAHPELLRVFNKANQAIGEQPQALAASVVAFAVQLIDPDAPDFTPVMQRIAHKHVSLGIGATQYTIVGHHLLKAVKTVLGDAITPEIAAAWDEVYWLMATELVARAEANGLVHRSADPDDGRRVILQLTPRGGAILDGLSVAHRDELRRFRREMNDVLRELDPQG